MTFDWLLMGLGAGGNGHLAFLLGTKIPEGDWSEEPIQSPSGSKEPLPEGEWSGSSFPNGDRSEAGGNSPIIFVPQRGLERRAYPIPFGEQRATSRRGVEWLFVPQRGSDLSLSFSKK